jgi:hypothetical protein
MIVEADAAERSSHGSGASLATKKGKLRWLGKTINTKKLLRGSGREWGEKPAVL